MLSTAYIYAYRALIVYFVILIVTRLLGKRELGQVSPFDFVVAIVLGELAVVSIDNTELPMWLGMVPIAVIVVSHLSVAYLSMKSIKARALLSGRPTIVIENGQIMEKNLATLRFNINDLMGSLREKGVFNPADVEFAVMENTGKLSVLLRSQERPVQAKDLGVPTDYEGLGLPVVMDGKVQDKYLKDANLDRDWLLTQLKEQGIDSPSSVLLALLSSQGELYVSRRGQSSKDKSS